MLNDLKNHLKVRPGYWFAPKLFGYGATPVTWQGWAVTAAFVAVVLVVPALMRNPIAVLAVILALTVSFAAFVHSKTDGGWRWRWGPSR